MLLTTLDEVYDYIQEQLEYTCSQIRVEFEESFCDTDRGLLVWADVSLENAPETVSIDFEFYFTNRKEELLEVITEALDDFRYYIDGTNYEIRAELLSLHMNGIDDVELVVKFNYDY